jgi:hypothetical protein
MARATAFNCENVRSGVPPQAHVDAHPWLRRFHGNTIGEACPHLGHLEVFRTDLWVDGTLRCKRAVVRFLTVIPRDRSTASFKRALAATAELRWFHTASRTKCYQANRLASVRFLTVGKLMLAKRLDSCRVARPARPSLASVGQGEEGPRSVVLAQAHPTRVDSAIAKSPRSSEGSRAGLELGRRSSAPPSSSSCHRLIRSEQSVLCAAHDRRCLPRTHASEPCLVLPVWLDGVLHRRQFVF